MMGAETSDAVVGFRDVASPPPQPTRASAARAGAQTAMISLKVALLSGSARGGARTQRVVSREAAPSINPRAGGFAAR
jgi:hypothetical protein